MWYILDENKKPKKVDSEEYSNWCYSYHNLKKVKQEYIDDFYISTVFLGLDYSMDRSGIPVLFETMIFKKEEDVYQERYTSYDDAVEGHQKAVDLVKTNTLLT